jgi:hypothetical protein
MRSWKQWPLRHLTAVTAACGVDARDLYVRMKEPFSLIILDLIMSTMGGKHCLKKVLKIDPQARLLIATASLLIPRQKNTLTGVQKGSLQVA